MEIIFIFSQKTNVSSLESKFQQDDEVVWDDDVTAERKRIMDESFDPSSDSRAVVSKVMYSEYGV